MADEYPVPWWDIVEVMQPQAEMVRKKYGDEAVKTYEISLVFFAMLNGEGRYWPNEEEPGPYAKQ